MRFNGLLKRPAYKSGDDIRVGLESQSLRMDRAPSKTGARNF
jgi:hypothetical protein